MIRKSIMNMSIEKVIEILDSGKAPETEQDFDDFETAMETAINLLKTHPDSQPNAPLTLEELREITELDILEKEGITVGFPQPKPSYVSLAYTETRLKPAVRKAFADLWDSTIKPADRARYGWDANPWVWVIGFERCGKPGTMCRA